MCLESIFVVFLDITSDSKNLDKLEYCITTVVCPGFFESDVICVDLKWIFLQKNQ